jgi:hypothetical protein
MEYVHGRWTESMRPAHGSTDLHKIIVVNSWIYGSDLMRPKGYHTIVGDAMDGSGFSQMVWRRGGQAARRRHG